MIFPALCLAVLGAKFQFNVTRVSLSTYSAFVRLHCICTSFPSKNQQLMASGILQTGTRLCGTVGVSIFTMILSSVQHSQIEAHGDEIQAYSATFCSFTAAAGASLSLIPFLTIGSQGGHAENNEIGEVEPGNVGVSLPPDDEKEMVGREVAVKVCSFRLFFVVQKPNRPNSERSLCANFSIKFQLPRNHHHCKLIRHAFRPMAAGRL